MDGSGPLHLFMKPLSVDSPHGLCSRVARLLLGGLSLLGAQRQKLPGFLRVRQRTGTALLPWWPHSIGESQGNPDFRGQDIPSKVWTLGNKVQLRPPTLQTRAAFIWESFHKTKERQVSGRAPLGTDGSPGTKLRFMTIFWMVSWDWKHWKFFKNFNRCFPFFSFKLCPHKF